jgi:hypothetical protein
MRMFRLVALACVVLMARPLFAQTKEWIEYKNSVDHFNINAPGEPTVEKTTWVSEYESKFPENIYRWQDGPNKYSVSVIDYSDSEAIYLANHHSDDFSAPAYWQIDILGSIQYAASKLYRLQPNVKITFDNFHYINLITGQQLTAVHQDGSRSYVGIYLHENRLYILDATVTKTAPAPIIFQQSFEIADAEGKAIRYRTYYFDKLPEPKAGRRGAGQGTQDPGAPPNPGPGQVGPGGQGGRGGRGGGQPQ